MRGTDGMVKLGWGCYYLCGFNGVEWVVVQLVEGAGRVQCRTDTVDAARGGLL